MKKPLCMFSISLPNQKEKTINWQSFIGSSKSLAIAETAKKYSGLTIVVTKDTLTAHQLEDETRFFLSSYNESLSLLAFPNWETLPYDWFSPHPDIISERLSTLAQLRHIKSGILFVPVHSFLYPFMPCETFHQSALAFRAGQSLNVTNFCGNLLKYGYRQVAQVMSHGEFATRGSILDIYPMGANQSYRIDLFDEIIDSIRFFNPETQRSLEKTNEVTLLPAHEIPLNEEAITLFRNQFRKHFSVNPMDCAMYRDITQGLYAEGIEYYLPLFFEKTSTLFDYLPSECLLIQDVGIEKALDQFQADVSARYEQLRHDVTRPILSPDVLFSSKEALKKSFESFKTIKISEEKAAIEQHVQSLPSLAASRKLGEPLSRLRDFLESCESRVLLTAESRGRLDLLTRQLAAAGAVPQFVNGWKEFLETDAKLCLTIAPISAGFCLETKVGKSICLISEFQIFEDYIPQQRRRKKFLQDSGHIVQYLTQLHIGDPVVHVNHGVGRYLGLKTIRTDGDVDEYLILCYADDAKLYVPVSSLHLISRYSGGDKESAPLHQLGSKKWEKTKRKAAAKIYDVAAELLDVYARRAMKKRPPFSVNESDYLAFVERFPFEETPDQQKSIDQVIMDLKSDNPMDRLICGDVGFGKTEVAMRAAFVAVRAKKQVAVLVPTTILTQQHYRSFCDRFAGLSVRIEKLSRIQTVKEQAEIINALASGKIDIIIGTHSLIQPKIKFHDLGLLVIDEEHRFGVRQKERLKSLRANVDILTLTATPIPRTLNMSFAGIRDLSIISTPPVERLSIKTFIHEYNAQIVKEAILREISRGGQVYFLHDKVETIGQTADSLQALLPQIRLRIAHGKMRGRELEKTMIDFYHREFHILVCTTIIESGIDVPTANTLIVRRADKLGLAQLHQLRGRVGRSHRQAYAYLFVPSKKLITADASRRLEALTESEELGAGFSLAVHDMEIRGAGELLGKEQSGHIQAVGFELFSEMLEKAVEALKKGEKIDLETAIEHPIEVDFRLRTLIPDDYLPDVQMRLILYKRIAAAKTDQDLENLRVEMIDRFGLLPKPVLNLFEVTAIKLQAALLGIRKIDVNASFGKITLSEKPRLDTAKLLELIQSHPKQYKLIDSNSFQFITDSESTEVQLEKTVWILKELQKII